MDDSINMTHTAHSECVNGVEIVAEETTPRHLSGGDKLEEGMPDMIVGASYAGAAAIAKNSADSVMNISPKPISSNPHRPHLKSKKMRKSDHLILITCRKI